MRNDRVQMAQLRFDEVDQAIYSAQKKDINQKISRLTSQARSNAKKSVCIMCKKECSSFCGSHSVPKFCLKNIAVEGKVLNSGLQEEFPILGEDVGIKKAGTFNIICRKCDGIRFQEYEDPLAYDQYPSEKILAQISMKNNLHQLSKKREELELYKLLQHKSGPRPLISAVKQQLKLLPLDIAQYHEAFLYAKLAESKKDKFQIFFYHKVDYVVPLAFQGTITLICDFEKKVINDVYTPGKKLYDIELAVFPLESSSIILGFVDQRNKKYNRFIQQFKNLSLSEQLATINYIIFSYSENVFVSKTLSDTVMKNRNFLDACQKSSIAVATDPEADCLSAAIDAFDLSKRNDIPNLLAREYALIRNAETHDKK